MEKFSLYTLALLAFVVITNIRETNGRDENNICPETCFCNKISKIIYCSRRGLTRIPSESIPSNSLQLNLNGNIFLQPNIKQSNFSRFSRLQHLYLSECGIEKIEPDTFTDLQSLQWLDLSNNRIKLIEEYTFRGLSLMHLFLSGNRNINFKRDSFSGLATIGLYLHECSLTKLNSDQFIHLNRSLQNLWLNGNELTKISKKFQSMFSTLTHLRLGANPFHCNCEMSWFKEIYDGQPDIFKGADPPSCLSPPRWKGKFINQMLPENFECHAPTFKNIDAVLKGNEGMLRCTAGGDPSPRLYWVQPSGLSTLYKPPANESVRFNQAVLNVSADSTRHNDLSGSYFCVALNEAGNMTFTFNVTWPSVGSAPAILPSEGEVTYKTIPADLNLADLNGNSDNNDRNVDNDYSDEEEIERNTPPSNNGNSDIFNNNKKSRLDGTYATDSPAPINGGRGNGVKQTDNGATDSDSNEDSSSHDSINNDITNSDRTSNSKLYTLTELICAIVGTFLCTLILCVILIPLYFRHRWKGNNSPRHSTAAHTNILGSSILRSGSNGVGSGNHHKSTSQEVRYLNGMGTHAPGSQTYNYHYDDYDNPGSLKR